MTPPNGPPVSISPKPTNVRYSMLFMLCLLAMITYLDRAMYGSAKGDMMAAVGRPVEDFFWVLVAFQLAYALFEVPTGWLGDRFGPRVTLIRLVLWWSLFVGLTPTVGLIFPTTVEVMGNVFYMAFAMLILMEFLFGMGEAGAFPNISRAAYNWFPAGQRGFAKGAVWMAARFAGGLTPVIWVLLTVYLDLSWRQALWLFTGVAAVWCLVFWIWFRNVPSQHWAPNESEKLLIESGKGHDGGRARSVPWRTIFTSRNLWAVCLMYTVTNFNWYFLMYYLPGALRGQYILSRAPVVEAVLQTPAGAAGAAFGGAAAVAGSEQLYSDRLTPAFLGGAPLLVGMLGCYLGGVLSDIHIRRTGNRVWGRRLYGMLGYGLAGLAYLSASLFTGRDDFWLFAGCLILVGLFNDLIMGPSWATTQDVGSQYSAIVGGMMNMVGNLGATIGNLITGLILKSYTKDGVLDPQGYVVCFVMYGVVYGLGVATWLLIDPTRPIVPDGSDSTPSADESR
ncbi:MAG TPA: MFS transporter [Gemmataceae bacterium]|nr:MFS transporter [Gemmataceae bacterium]